MSFEIEMPESTDRSGNFLSEAGTYHFAVNAIDEAPSTKSGAAINGFKVSASVLAGTVPGQENKETGLIFRNPKYDAKDGGEFQRKKQARFVMAIGLLDGPRPAGEKVTVDLQQARGRQFIATVEKSKNQDGKETGYVDIAFADIWHVDDPEAKAFPKNEAALKLLPASLRKKPEQFPSHAKTNGAATNGNRNVSNTTPPATTAAATGGSGVNIDDL